MEAGWKPKKYVCDGGCGGCGGSKCHSLPFIVIIVFHFTESHFYPPQPPHPPHPPLLLFLKKINNNKIRRETEYGKQTLI